jgi:hypothetical protein
MREMLWYVLLWTLLIIGAIVFLSAACAREMALIGK